MKIRAAYFRAVILLLAGTAPAGPMDWPEAMANCRPWAYNWWLGSAVDQENLARELHRYREVGLGGIHIVPIYGVKGAENRAIDYLCPKWMEMLTFAVQEGQRLGLGVDMTTGTGWCFGGPTITPELGGRKMVVKAIPFPANGTLPEDLSTNGVTFQALVAIGPNRQRHAVTDQVKPDGSLAWIPPTDGWTLYALGHRFTGTMVKRAAPGGAGPMLNPFYAESMRKYLERFTAAFADGNVAQPRAMYHDSFEYQGANWSPDLLAQFAQRRGYRLQDEIEALAGQGPPDRIARVRCDLGETLSDLLIERVFPIWVEWCHARNIQTRCQAHGAPVNWLDFYALADIPETEMFGHGGPDPLVSRFDEHLAKADRNPLIAKFASSAAHGAGKPLVASETGTWLAEHFCETFEELKAEIDLLFLAGVNHIFYHGCVYSPDDAAWPGWLFYASTQMNPRNPLWREAPALNQYVARCQSILRNGTPDNDVLLYWPIHEAWSRSIENMSVHNQAALQGTLGPAASSLWTRGYGFDYVSDRLLAPMESRNGTVQAPGGAVWRAVVVPECHQIPHATLAKLIALAKQGATVVFENYLPHDVPGLGQLPARRAVWQDLMDRLRPAGLNSPTNPPLLAVPCGEGRILLGTLEKALVAAGIEREQLVDHPGVKYIRRRHRQGWHYLIVNHGLQPLTGWVALATPARSIVVMDPLSGKCGIAPLRPSTHGMAEIYLGLESGHSIILRTFEQEQIEGPAWAWPKSGAVATEIRGPWQVEFIAGGPQLPAPVVMSELKSWTTGDDPAAEAFAGTARYRCQFDLTTELLSGPGAPLWVDLGEVKHLARVRINGEDLGALMMHPYRLAISSSLLRAQGNWIEVEVTNLAANRIRDLDRRKVNWRIFRDINFVNLQYRPFEASRWPVFESGLLGPVRIRVAE